jgi:beta-lactamase superfamily II metal-dependent hydrolase
MLDYAVLSDSSGNKFGHPYIDALGILDQVEVKLYRADKKWAEV